MDAQLTVRAPHVTDVEAALAQAADLVKSGLAAFLEGNPFRGRRVQEAGRRLLLDLDAWQERTLSTWPEDEADFERRHALANHAETLVRAAQQLGGLAESRPSTQMQADLRERARTLAGPLEDVLVCLSAPGVSRPATDALGAVQQGKKEFMAWCMTLGRANPRLFSSCLLAVAAAQRIEEAAEAATAAANLLAPRMAAC